MAKAQEKKAKPKKAKKAKNMKELSAKTRRAISAFFQVIGMERRLKFKKAELDELVQRIPKKELPEYKRGIDNIRKAVEPRRAAMLKQSSKP